MYSDKALDMISLNILVIRHFYLDSFLIVLNTIQNSWENKKKTN